MVLSPVNPSAELFEAIASRKLRFATSDEAADLARKLGQDDTAHWYAVRYWWHQSGRNWIVRVCARETGEVLGDV